MTTMTELNSHGPITDRLKSLPRHRWSLPALRFLATTAVVFLIVRSYQWWTRRLPMPPTEIFQGVTYTCFEATAPECKGLVHLVKVDLSAVEIQLYSTSLDPEAVSKGYEYRLDWAANVLNREHLAVVINAAMFSSNSGLFQMSGDLARGGETIVSDGAVDHVDPNSYLLWFERDLTPHLEFAKPPPDTALQRAEWGVSGQGVALWKGKVGEGDSGHGMNRRTAIAIDASRRLLWLAVFENASSAGVARALADQGAQDGLLVDGGHSTAMVLGAEAAKVKPGELIGGSRPVATFFGVRALPINLLRMN